MKRCRHCNKSDANRPRGLCWTCYYTPGLRNLYPSTSKYARRGLSDVIGAVKPPTHPTSAPPGSPEKVAILEQRARSKQSLWHKNDATLDLEGLVRFRFAASAG